MIHNNNRKASPLRKSIHAVLLCTAVIGATLTSLVVAAPPASAGHKQNQTFTATLAVPFSCVNDGRQLTWTATNGIPGVPGEETYSSNTDTYSHEVEAYTVIGTKPGCDVIAGQRVCAFDAYHPRGGGILCADDFNQITANAGRSSSDPYNGQGSDAHITGHCAYESPGSSDDPDPAGFNADCVPGRSVNPTDGFDLVSVDFRIQASSVVSNGLIAYQAPRCSKYTWSTSFGANTFHEEPGAFSARGTNCPAAFAETPETGEESDNTVVGEAPKDDPFFNDPETGADLDAGGSHIPDGSPASLRLFNDTRTLVVGDAKVGSSDTPGFYPSCAGNLYLNARASNERVRDPFGDFQTYERQVFRAKAYTDSDINPSAHSTCLTAKHVEVRVRDNFAEHGLYSPNSPEYRTLWASRTDAGGNGEGSVATVEGHCSWKENGDNYAWCEDGTAADFRLRPTGWMALEHADVVLQYTTNQGVNRCMYAQWDISRLAFSTNGWGGAADDIAGTSNAQCPDEFRPTRATTIDSDYQGFQRDPTDNP